MEASRLKRGGIRNPYIDRELERETVRDIDIELEMDTYLIDRIPAIGRRSRVLRDRSLHFHFQACIQRAIYN